MTDQQPPTNAFDVNPSGAPDPSGAAPQGQGPNGAAPAAPIPPAQQLPPAPALMNRPIHAGGLEYHEALRTPGTPWWKGLLAILLFVAGFLLVSSVFGGIAIVIDIARGAITIEQAGLVNTPVFMALSILSLALTGPLAALVQWLMFGQKPRWIHSVTGGVRWGWFGRLAAVITPVMAVYMVLFNLPSVRDPQPVNTWFWYLLVAIFLIPFQSASEEYGFRGLINRSAATWSSNAGVSFILGALVSSVLFAIAHGAADIWLNIYYFIFGILLSFVTRVTGGLEAAVVVHAANNVTALVIASLTQDLSGMFDRSAGTAGPIMLIQMAFLTILCAGIVWWGRRRGLQTRTPDPEASAPAPASTGSTMPAS